MLVMLFNRINWNPLAIDRELVYASIYIYIYIYIYIIIYIYIYIYTGMPHMC